MGGHNTITQALSYRHLTIPHTGPPRVAAWILPQDRQRRAEIHPTPRAITFTELGPLVGEGAFTNLEPISPPPPLLHSQSEG